MYKRQLNDLVSRGVPAPKLLISDRCQVVMPYHKELDGMEEARLAAKSFGSTKSGIAPFYSDKSAKMREMIHTSVQEPLCQRKHRHCLLYTSRCV